MAVHIQRYVSTELTHFVGRPHLNDLEAQYQVLLEILTSSELLPGGTRRGREVAATPDGRLCDDEFYQASVVCFCDIPVADLHLHMQKYGRFGLAFSKRFLVTKGASPVFYVARDAVHSARQTRGDVFEEMAAEYERFRMALLMARPVGEVERLLYGNVEDTSLRHMLHQLLFNVFAFVKCFNGEAPEAHPDNFYMEREWRVHGEVDFELERVRQIIAPREYFRRLRDDIPGYEGELIAAPRVEEFGVQ